LMLNKEILTPEIFQIVANGKYYMIHPGQWGI
jgi:hypothetical protein